MALDDQATISLVSTGTSFFGATGPWDGDSSVSGLFSVEMFKGLTTDDPLTYLCSTFMFLVYSTIALFLPLSLLFVACSRRLTPPPPPGVRGLGNKALKRSLHLTCGPFQRSDLLNFDTLADVNQVCSH
jgi:hypothetical protein